jgi:hypothetical protein
MCYVSRGLACRLEATASKAKDLTATTLNSFRRHGLTQTAFLLPHPSSNNLRSCQRCGRPDVSGWRGAA